jgi:hypothetical protein
MTSLEDLQKIVSAAISDIEPENYVYIYSDGFYSPEVQAFQTTFTPILITKMIEEIKASREAWDSEGETYLEYRKARNALDAELGHKESE